MIKKEFHELNKRGVLKIIKKSKNPPDCKYMKSNGFLKSRDMEFLARLVACGYSQIPGVEFSKKYSPVVLNVTFRLLLVLKIIHGYSVKIANVETNFLWGDLVEEIVQRDLKKQNLQML